MASVADAVGSSSNVQNDRFTVNWTRGIMVGSGTLICSKLIFRRSTKQPQVASNELIISQLPTVPTMVAKRSPLPSHVKPK